MSENNNKSGLVNYIEFPPLGDDRGHLVALEFVKGPIPFEIKRVYYLFDTKKGVTRGYHAHRDLKQVAVCVKGSCSFTLDDGYERRDITLNDATKGILIESMVWREMKDFSPDCVLLVVASEPYDESDYIRDYQKFIDAVRRK